MPMASSNPDSNVITVESIQAAFLGPRQEAINLSQEAPLISEPMDPSDVPSNEVQEISSEQYFLALFSPAIIAPMGRKAQKRLERSLQSQKKATEKNALLARQFSAVIAINPYRYPVGSIRNTRAWKDVVDSLVRQNILKNGDGVRQRLQKNVSRYVAEFKKSFVIPEPEARPARDFTEIEMLAGEIYQLQISGAPLRKVFRKNLPDDDSCGGFAMDISANTSDGIGSGDREESEEEVINENAKPNLLLVHCLSDARSRKSNLTRPDSGAIKSPLPKATLGTPFDHAVVMPVAYGNRNINAMTLENIHTNFLGTSQEAVSLSQEPTMISESVDPSNMPSNEVQEISNPQQPLAACPPAPIVPLNHMGRKAEKRLERKLQSQKKAAKKNASVIKQLSTVIAENPYRYPVGSSSNTKAWTNVVESLVRENITKNGDGVRQSVRKKVSRCVKEYKQTFIVSQTGTEPERELTEIERLAGEIYQLQVSGATACKVYRKRLLDDDSCDDLAMDVTANSYHGVGLGDYEESEEEVANEIFRPNSLPVHCVSDERSRKSDLARFSSGAPKSRLPRAPLDTPTQAEDQYFLLCSMPTTPLPPTVSRDHQNTPELDCTKPCRSKKLRVGEKCALCLYRFSGNEKPRSVFRFPEDELRQKKWVKVCLQVDQGFKLRQESFVCEEHFAPESFGVPRVRNGVESMRLRWCAVPLLLVEEKGHWRNCEADFESDEEMEVEGDRRVYENGLPAAVRLPSGLPNTRISENHLLSENGKENVCEDLCCPTCGIVEEPCWQHAKFIRDKNVYPLAYSSLPTALEFKPDENKGPPAGVVSRIPLRPYTVFGPMRGALCSHISSRFGVPNSFGWKYYHLDSEDICNWMTYVRFAETAQEQNLAAYVKDEQIFFIATRGIKSDEELKVWYSRKYADLLGFVSEDKFGNADNVEDGFSADGDGVSQNYADGDVTDESLESESTELPLKDLDENAIHDARDNPEELTDDSVESRIFSSRNNQQKIMKSARPMNQMMKNEDDSEMSSSFEDGSPVEDQQPVAPDFAFSSNVAEDAESGKMLPEEHTDSDQLSRSNRKKSAKRRLRKVLSSTIEFPCAECRIHFPNEQCLILHNYQHSSDLDDEVRACPECGDVFEHPGDLNQHVLKHGKNYFPVEKSAHCDGLISVERKNEHSRDCHPGNHVPSTEVYPCTKCGVEFSGKKAYHRHVSANHGRRLDCMFCGKIETASIAMGHHVLLHKAEDGFHCPKCPKVFATYVKLRNHNNLHNKAKPGKKGTGNSKRKVSKFFIDPSTKIKFPCAFCRKSYKTEALLDVHRRFHKTELDKSYKGDDVERKCPECGEEFDTVDGIFRHVEGHGVAFYAREQCRVCKKFIAAHLLERHMEGNHPRGETENAEEYPCKVCQKVFSSKMKHGAHIQMHKPKKCLLCAEIFDGWRKLGRHTISVHKQADGFHCQNCDAVFDTFRHLTNHHRNRHDIRSIVSCELCGKMCRNRSTLLRHMDVEHGSKEFSHECDVCGKKFMRRTTLRSHVAWTHTARGRKKVHDSQVEFMKKGYVAPRKRMMLEEFPFKCETCQVGFLVEGRLLRHMTKFHPEEA